MLILVLNDEGSVRKADKLKDERFMMKVLKMYYKNGMSQVAIGKKLNVSRMTVARVLEQARKEGYVQIKINFPENSAANEEEILEQKFNLQEAIIVYPREGEQVIDEIGFLTADYMIRILKNHMTLALTKGITLQKVAQYLENDMRLRLKKFEDVKVVPLSGSNNAPETADEEYRLAYSNYLIDVVAQILKIKAYQVMAPLFVADGQMKEKLMEEESVREIIQMAEKADVAVFGIGSLDYNSTVLNTDIIPPSEFERLKEKGGVGEILCHVFDVDGNLVQDNFDERLVAVSFDRLKKIPIRVGVAYGKEKREAILGALRAGAVNVLITDMDVAEFLMKV